MKKNIIILYIAFLLTLPNLGVNDIYAQNKSDFETKDSYNVIKQTGDFTYNIPLLEIPSPNGSFPINLTYQSGIKLEQDASWVGLGWSFEPGSITRTVSQYPDDMSFRQLFSVYKSRKFVDPTQQGPSIFGQILTILANGIIKNYMNPSIPAFSYQVGPRLNTQYFTDSPHDFNYSQSLFTPDQIAPDYSSLYASYVNLNTQDYFSFEYDDFQVLSRPDPSFKVLLFSKISSVYGFLYQQDIGKYNVTGGASDFHLYWNSVTSISTEHLEEIYPEINNSAITSYTIDKFSVSSDVFQEKENDEDALHQNSSPVFQAIDNYQLSVCNGFSGTLRPIRFDNPSVAPSVSSTKHDYDNNYFKLGVVNHQTEKPQFILTNDNSNSYLGHLEGNEGEFVASDIVLENSVSDLWYDSGQTDNNNTIVYDKSSQPGTIKNIGIVSDDFISASNRLIKGNHIEWYSNNEFTDGTAKNAGVINFEISFKRAASIYPEEGIGGYTVTTVAGYTYHFTLPVYNVKYSTTFFSPRTINGEFVIGIDKIDIFNEKYAYKWLLTAITGPDFIDNGVKGIIDDADFGYYVKFDYGKFTNDYSYCNPFGDYYHAPGSYDYKYLEHGVKEEYYLNAIKTSTHTALFIKDYRIDNKSYYFKDILNVSYDDDEWCQYYKDLYGDGFNCAQIDPTNDFDVSNFYLAHNTAPSFSSDVRYSLALKEIILLKNEDYEDLTLNQGFTFNQTNENHKHVFHNYTNVIMMDDITSTIRTKIDDVQLQRIVFNQDNSLCNKTPDAYNTNILTTPNRAQITDATEGKLTLNSIEFYSLNKKNTPDYIFKYNNNPNYISNQNVDGWGYYSTDTRIAENKATEENGNAWNLNKIITPIGHVINIEYERDKYKYIQDISLSSSHIGGDVRVKKIGVNDPIGDKTFNIEYNYNNSGVCTQEPVLSRFNGEQDFYHEFGIMQPMVFYGKITESYKNVTNDLQRYTDYEYYTPTRNLLSMVSNVQSGPTLVPLLQCKHIREDKTSLIGKTKSITKRNSKNDILKKIEFSYTDNLNLGNYTQASNLVDFTIVDRVQYNRTINTIYKWTPSILNQVVLYENGKEIIIDYSEFDEQTGKVVKKIGLDGSKTIRIDNLLAYRLSEYENLNSKYWDISNKNMLSQQAASISYLNDEPIGVSIQTWGNKWDYRDYDESSNSYVENEETGIWRKHKQFVWKGDFNSDGTYGTNFSDYDTPDKLASRWQEFNGESTTKWEKVNEITQYNHYSAPLESKDINGHYASAKMDINSEKTIATAANASYKQFTYSGFENQKEGDYVEGEVKLKSSYSQLSNSYSHTGDYSLQTYGLSNAFEYKVEGIENGYNSPYKMSLWALTNSLQAIRLDVDFEFYNSSNSLLYTDSHILSSYQKQGFGDWYLFDIITPKPGNIPNADQINKIVINVDNGLSKEYIYIDDFRVHPVNAPMQSYVYDHLTGAVTAILDNNNIATKYEYDDAGKLKTVKKEIPGEGTNGGFKKVSEHNYGYARPVTDELVLDNADATTTIIENTGERSVTVRVYVQNNDLVDRTCNLNCNLQGYEEKTSSETIPVNGTGTLSFTWKLPFGNAASKQVDITGDLEHNFTTSIPGSPDVNLNTFNASFDNAEGSITAFVNYKNDGYGKGTAYGELSLYRYKLTDRIPTEIDLTEWEYIEGQPFSLVDILAGADDDFSHTFSNLTIGYYLVCVGDRGVMLDTKIINLIGAAKFEMVESPWGTSSGRDIIANVKVKNTGIKKDHCKVDFSGISFNTQDKTLEIEPGQTRTFTQTLSLGDGEAVTETVSVFIEGELKGSCNVNVGASPANMVFSNIGLNLTEPTEGNISATVNYNNIGYSPGTIGITLYVYKYTGPAGDIPLGIEEGDWLPIYEGAYSLSANAQASGSISESLILPNNGYYRFLVKEGTYEEGYSDINITTITPPPTPELVIAEFMDFQTGNIEVRVTLTNASCSGVNVTLQFVGDQMIGQSITPGSGVTLTESNCTAIFTVTNPNNFETRVRATASGGSIGTINSDILTLGSGSGDVPSE